jgi:hypothetical protein
VPDLEIRERHLQTLAVANYRSIRFLVTPLGQAKGRNAITLEKELGETTVRWSGPARCATVEVAGALSDVWHLLPAKGVRPRLLANGV